ncbi:MAG: HEPN domain-containing protein [Elusimicrobiota bacterium]
MSPKNFKTRSVSRDRHGIYLKKAQEFLRASESALKIGDWNAAGLNAVHAAISSADALLVYYAGVRSSGDSHYDVVGLLRQHIKDDSLGSKIQTLSKVLGYKNFTAYEDRELTEAEGKNAQKLAQRFLEWAQSHLL